VFFFLVCVVLLVSPFSFFFTFLLQVFCVTFFCLFFLCSLVWHVIVSLFPFYFSLWVFDVSYFTCLVHLSPPRVAGGLTTPFALAPSS